MTKMATAIVALFLFVALIPAETVERPDGTSFTVSQDSASGEWVSEDGGRFARSWRVERAAGWHNGCWYPEKGYWYYSRIVQKKIDYKTPGWRDEYAKGLREYLREQTEQASFMEATNALIGSGILKPRQGGGYNLGGSAIEGYYSQQKQYGGVIQGSTQYAYRPSDLAEDQSAIILAQALGLGHKRLADLYESNADRLSGISAQKSAERAKLLELSMRLQTGLAIINSISANPTSETTRFGWKSQPGGGVRVIEDPDNPPDDALRKKIIDGAGSVLQTRCASCHSPDGKNGVLGKGAKFPNGVDLTKFLEFSRDQIDDVIRVCNPAMPKAERMPKDGEPLTQEEFRAVVLAASQIGKQ